MIVMPREKEVPLTISTCCPHLFLPPAMFWGKKSDTAGQISFTPPEESAGVLEIPSMPSPLNFFSLIYVSLTIKIHCCS